MVEIRRALIIILFLLVGCASKSVVVQETLLADGLTWKIEIELKNVYQDYAVKCNHVDRKIFSFEDCIQKMIIRDYDQYLMNYTRELCGRMPHRMFATSISHLNEMKSTKMSTYVECIDKYKIVEQQIYENLLRPSAEGAMRAPAMGPPFMMEK